LIPRSWRYFKGSFSSKSFVFVRPACFWVLLILKSESSRWRSVPVIFPVRLLSPLNFSAYIIGCVSWSIVLDIDPLSIWLSPRSNFLGCGISGSILLSKTFDLLCVFCCWRLFLNVTIPYSEFPMILSFSSKCSLGASSILFSSSTWIFRLEIIFSNSSKLEFFVSSFLFSSACSDLFFFFSLFITYMALNNSSM